MGKCVYNHFIHVNILNMILHISKTNEIIICCVMKPDFSAKITVIKISPPGEFVVGL